MANTSNKISWIVQAIKNDSKTIWTIVFVVGGLLGYSLPEDWHDVMPEIKCNCNCCEEIKTTLEQINTKLTKVEEGQK